ncbi:MAG: hypothetical protein ACPLZD_03495 [Candidatus Saccharicenans sp.]|nr:MAG: hypothetical protein C0168_02920 [Candidatus Aminicenantes bacterium]HEK86478.1 hypothetical protein [Candidatus Aminicenantes bacterium]
MKNKKGWFLSLVGLFLITSIQLMGISALNSREDLKINLVEKKISALTPSGEILSFYLKIENHGTKNFFLVSYRYQVLINQKEYLRKEIVLDNPLAAYADQPLLINFPVKIDYQYVSPYLSGSKKQASCLVIGEMNFQDERKKTEEIPFNWQMDFPIFNFPTLKFLPLLVKDLTLGGAEFDFRFELKNENSYDLLIKKIQAELQLEGKTIYRGELPGDKTLSAGEGKRFSLPLMLDFFEQGRAFRDSLEKETSDFILKLQIEADSAWGELSFSLEKREQVKKEYQGERPEENGLNYNRYL